MGYHLFLIVRFFCYVSVTILGLTCMIRAADDTTARRLVAVASLTAVMFNQALSRIVYNLLASFFETVAMVAGLCFLIVLMITLVLLPVIIAIGWLKSK